VADIVPSMRRGTAFGWYYLAIGMAALPASVIFGMVWDRFGSHAAFNLGASLAIAAAVGISVIPGEAGSGRRSGVVAPS
jgi:dipeptide/tripeptide permease